MEMYATNDNLQNRLTLKKIKKLVEVTDSAKRSIAELIRAQ